MVEVIIIYSNYTLFCDALCVCMCVVAALAVAVCFTCNGLVAYSVNQMFPFLLTALQSHGFLYLLATVDLVAVLVVLLFFPETKVCVCVCVCMSS